VHSKPGLLTGPAPSERGEDVYFLKGSLKGGNLHPDNYRLKAFPGGCIPVRRLLKYEKQLEEILCCQYGLVKVSTGILQVEKLSEADRQTANLNINANNNKLALAA